MSLCQSALTKCSTTSVSMLTSDCSQCPLFSEVSLTHSFLFPHRWVNFCMLSFAGPSECVYSRSGQQTGHEGLHDGEGDLWVSDTQHHYQAPVAYPGMLCSHWWRVSLTLLKFSFYVSECECFHRHHTWVSNPETAFLSLPAFSVYLLVSTGWGPRLLPTKQQLRNFLTRRTRWPQMPVRAGTFPVFCWTPATGAPPPTLLSSSVQILREGALRSIYWCGLRTCWIIRTVNPQWSEGSEEADQFLLESYWDNAHIFAWRWLFIPLISLISGSILCCGSCGN